MPGDTVPDAEPQVKGAAKWSQLAPPTCAAFIWKPFVKGVETCAPAIVILDLTPGPGDMGHACIYQMRKQQHLYDMSLATDDNHKQYLRQTFMQAMVDGFKDGSFKFPGVTIPDTHPPTDVMDKLPRPYLSSLVWSVEPGNENSTEPGAARAVVPQNLTDKWKNTRIYPRTGQQSWRN